jgi:hypothetical protein
LLRIPPGHELLLNDVGIVKFRGSFATEPVPFTLGWSGDCHHWLMPLSPHVALTIAPDNKYWLGTGSPGWVEAVNRRLVLDAHRYVYSRGFESAVQQWWDEAATNEA